MTHSSALRRAAKRNSERSARITPDPAKHIARINDIAQTCRTTWFGLLSYLAFVGVTLMGVEDVDFFLPGQDTKLPLIGVSVPTLLFFAIGPAIGALIYAYFHMHLLKLWEALADAPAEIDGTPLSDHIKPWLVIDLCLSYRTDGALRPRPLARNSNIINFLFAFWGTPVVLIALWWASTPPHADWLTLLACGLPLIFSLFVGLSSWQRMRALVTNPDANPSGLSKTQCSVLALAACTITTLGWLRVEGTFRNYALVFFDEDQVTGSLADWEILAFLTPADLSDVNFANIPSGWQDRDTYRLQYRTTWCNKVGLQANICGPAPDLVNPEWKPIVGVTMARTKWCSDLSGNDGDPTLCETIFVSYERDFEMAWLQQRELDLASLPTFDLYSADLRRAYLRGAQMQGAYLEGAQLQGADLGEARLQGAYLEGAQLQGADLGEARLQGAYLEGAQLQGADLGEARLQGAYLEGAQMQGAYLEGAQMQGAYLRGAQFDASTSLTAATLRGAAVKEVDFTSVSLIFPHLQDIYGDASVELPNGITPDHADWPPHWSKEDLEWSEFREKWRAWQATLQPGWDTPTDQ